MVSNRRLEWNFSLQYAVEEAADAGIEQFIFVTSRGKSAIENHFDHSFELENNLLLLI